MSRPFVSFSEKTRNLLSNFKSKSKIFYTQWIRNFRVEGDLDSFIYRRQNLMNKIKENFASIFETEFSKQILFNLFQILFVVLNEVPPSQSKKAELIDNLFHAACFIVIKLDCQDKLAIFKEYLLENNFDYEAILHGEVLLLNKLSWNINLITPSEITLNLTKELFSPLSSEDPFNFQNSEAHMSFLVIIEFAFSDLAIYLKFDLYIITISSLIFAFELCNMDSAFTEGLLANLSEEDINSIKNCYEVIKEEIEKTNESQMTSLNNNTEDSENSNNLNSNVNYLSSSSNTGNFREIETNFITEEEGISNQENTENDNSLNFNSNLTNENITENFDGNKNNVSNGTINSSFSFNKNKSPQEVKEDKETLAFKSFFDEYDDEDEDDEKATEEEINSSCCDKDSINHKNNFEATLAQENKSEGGSAFECFQSPVLNLREDCEARANNGKGFFSSEAPPSSHSNRDCSDCSSKGNKNYCYQCNYEETNKLNLPCFSNLLGNYPNQNTITQFSPLDLLKTSGLNVKSTQAEKGFEFESTSNLKMENKNSILTYNLKKISAIPCYLDPIENLEYDVSSNFFLKKKKNFLEEVVIAEKPPKEAEFGLSYKYDMSSTEEESPLKEKTYSYKLIKNIYKGCRSNNNNKKK